MTPQAESPSIGSSTSVLRPTGTSWFTVTLGALCLVLAAVIMTVQLSDLAIDWSIATPAFVVGAGVLLILLGVASLVRGRPSNGSTPVGVEPGEGS